MGVIIGSARSDEHGKITGGKPGDQKGGAEVSTQAWYLHSKGWYVIRAVDSKVADKIASTMEDICNSKYVGYNQLQRNQLYETAALVDWDCKVIKVNVNTDCSATVRVCVRAATGVSVPDFNTSIEKTTLLSLKKKGKNLFKLMEGNKYTTQPDYLKRGDILVTRTKGHTVVVLSNGAKVNTKDKIVNKVENTVTAIKTTPKTTYYPAYKGKKTSIADALKEVGYNGSFTRRKQIAKANNIINYTGTAAQNAKLLKLLKSGRLILE